MNTELLPCPFCGSDARIEAAYYDQIEFFVSCMQCDADGPPAGDDASARSAWNRRVPSSTLLQERDVDATSLSNSAAALRAQEKE